MQSKSPLNYLKQLQSILSESKNEMKPDELVDKLQLSQSDREIVIKTLNENAESGLKSAILNYSPYGLDINIYKQLLPYTTVLWLSERNGTAQNNAYKLAVAFGNTDKALKFLQDFANENKQAAHPVHDACNLLNLPVGQDWNVPVWQQLIAKYALNRKFQTALANAGQIEILLGKQKQQLENTAKTAAEEKNGIDSLTNQIAAEKNTIQKKLFTSALELAQVLLTKDIRRINKTRKKLMDAYQLHAGMKPEQLFELTSQITYKNGAINPEAALLFMAHHIPEDIYDQYINLKTKTKDYIPDITIDGAVIGAPSLYLKKLNPKNPRAAILGILTGCCQSLGGQGEECAIHGMTSPYGGFYVVCRGSASQKKETDEILSQCWVWRSQRNNLVFDSIETQPVIRQSANMFNVNRLYMSLAWKLVEEKHAEQVAVGAGGTTKNLGIPDMNVHEIPLEAENVIYKGYRDSGDSQALLADINQPILLYIFNGDEMKVRNYLKEHPKKIIQDTIPLLMAIMSQHLEITKIILQEIEKLIPDDKLRNKFFIAKGESNHPIFYAISAHNISVVKYMLEKGFDVNYKAEGYKTLLQVAAYAGDDEIVKLLVESKAEANSPKEFYNNLYIASIGGHAKIIKYLIEHSAQIERCVQDPLELATLSGKVDAVKYFIEELKIGSPERINQCLITAAVGGHLDLVKYLLQKGANINSKYNSKETTIDRDQRKSYDFTALKEAIAHEQWEIAKLLVDQKADLNIGTHLTSGTALHQSISAKNHDFTRYLVNNKANVNLVNLYEETPLDRAIKEEDFNMIDFLLEQKADINFKKSRSYSYWDRSSLYHAVDKAIDTGNAEIVKLLIEKKVNIRTVAGWEWGQFESRATDKKHFDLIQILLESKVDISLEGVASTGNLTSVKYLITEKKVPSEQYEAAIKAAIKNGHKEVVKYFVDLGVKVDEPALKQFGLFKPEEGKSVTLDIIDIKKRGKS